MSSIPKFTYTSTELYNDLYQQSCTTTSAKKQRMRNDYLNLPVPDMSALNVSQLSFAAINGDLIEIRALLIAGADKDLNINGATALDWAKSFHIMVINGEQIYANPDISPKIIYALS